MNKMKIRLKRTPKRYFFDTHRALIPKETLEKVEELKEIVGITRMEDITSLDKLNIPIYSASRPGAKEGAVSVYTGKGLTREQARVSVIMEAIERYSAEIKDEDKAKFLVESYDENRNGGEEREKVDPVSLILSKLSTIGPSSKLEWCKGYDLLREEEIFVPANAVFHPYVSNRGGRLFRSDTNGIASGNNLEEAIFHGITEVIERDALSYVELKKNAGKQIEVGEDDGRIFELKERFESAGIVPHFWYIPSDTGFTTVALALDDESKDGSLLVYGAGAHSDPRIATIRAITEAAQSRLMQIESAKRDAVKATLARVMSYEGIKKRNRHWFEDKDKGKDKGEEEKVRLDELPDLATDTIDGDIEVALEKLRQVVNQVIVVDLTREEIGIPVVRVIIPGFEVYARNQERVGCRYR